MKNQAALWDKVIENIKKKVNSPTFNSFISPVFLRDISDSPPLAHLECENSMVVNIVNKRYIHLFAEALSEILGEDYKVILKSTLEYKENVGKSSLVEPLDPIDVGVIFRDQNIFDPNLTFENFVIGDCNNIAAAMCKAVAETPFHLYNPLFIHGNSGLGKTHLLNSVGIYLLEHNQDIRVLYVSAETFTNDYILSLQRKKEYEFKEKYRRADVLLIDDIQFLENKLQTQNEFYNTIETLWWDKKQIIVSGDRSPADLKTVDERLKSRLMMNTTVSVTAPDYETRIAILRDKAEKMNVDGVEEINEIIEFIADKFPDNIRTLCGAFDTVVNVTREIHQEPSVSIAKILLKDIAKGEVNVTPQKIKASVAKYYNIRISDLDSTSRVAEYAYPRQVAMYLCRTMTDFSLPRIGEIFGNKHYSTVKHGCDKIDKELKTNIELKDAIDEIKKNIGSL